MVSERILVKESEGVLNILLNGDLEITTIKSVEQEIMHYVDQMNKDIELDFTNLNYLDSSGIGVLIKLSKMLKANGNRLRLINLPEKISQILKLSSLYDDLEDNNIEIS